MHHIYRVKLWQKKPSVKKIFLQTLDKNQSTTNAVKTLLYIEGHEHKEATICRMFR